MATPKSKPFPFLAIPPEIREKIYILICHQSAPISLHIPFTTPQGSPETSFPHAFLQTCTLIYNELRPIYFTHNTFILSIRRRNDDLTHFLSASFQDNRRQIRSLKIVIYRFGSHDFFTKEFAPVLEDSILNGRLRDLEVIVKEGFLRVVKNCHAYQERSNGTSPTALAISRDWVALKRTMLDPYLERRKLKSGDMDVIDAVVGVELDGASKLNDVTWMLGDLDIEQNKAYGERMRT